MKFSGVLTWQAPIEPGNSQENSYRESSLRKSAARLQAFVDRTVGSEVLCLRIVGAALGVADAC